MISVLCPTRGRPEKCLKMVNSALNMCGDERLEILLYIADNDQDVDVYKNLFNDYQNVKIYIGPDQPTSMSWNFLSRLASGNLLMLVGDDCIFKTKYFDRILIDKYNDLQDKIACFSFQDGRGRVGESHPHPVMTKEWVKCFGYFVRPEFNHWYIDTYNISLAKKIGCFYYIKEILVDHQKDSDLGKFDETHKRIRANGWKEHDKSLWSAYGEQWLEADMFRYNTHCLETAKKKAGLI